MWLVCAQSHYLCRTWCECVVLHVVGVSSDSSIRCQPVWCNEKFQELGGMVDGRLSGHTNGDNRCILLHVIRLLMNTMNKPFAPLALCPCFSTPTSNMVSEQDQFQPSLNPGQVPRSHPYQAQLSFMEIFPLLDRFWNRSFSSLFWSFSESCQEVIPNIKVHLQLGGNRDISKLHPYSQLVMHHFKNAFSLKLVFI